jgi:hypothetical protein
MMSSSTSMNAAKWGFRRAAGINVSDANFTPHGQAIRFGLAAVKNVGSQCDRINCDCEGGIGGRRRGPYLGRNLQVNLRVLREG